MNQTKKELFIASCLSNEGAKLFVRTVLLPSGHKEVISTTDVKGQTDYIKGAYNDDMQLIANNKVSIEGWLFA